MGFEDTIGHSVGEKSINQSINHNGLQRPERILIPVDFKKHSQIIYASMNCFCDMIID